jgi:hypothetical protein
MLPASRQFSELLSEGWTSAPASKLWKAGQDSPHPLANPKKARE